MTRSRLDIVWCNTWISLSAILTLVLLSACASVPRIADPLLTWRDGAAKQAIEQFVSRVTTEGGTEFVPARQRIAVFDNDGTLWSEKPWVEGEFKKYQIKKAAERDPSRRDEQPYKAAFENDLEYFETGGWPVILGPARTVTAELSRDQFDAEAKEFFATARHPELRIPFQQTVYQPVIELIEYLRSNDFDIYICSGGAVDFMRVMSSELYGIEPGRVIGTSYKKKLQKVDGKYELQSTTELNVFNNKDEKAINIDLHIGQRPLFAMGNAGGKGDIGMLGYSQGREGPSLQLLIDHNDEEREFAYAEEDNESLNEANANGWLVVSMKDDWSSIYPSRDEQ